ncbi:hypothetical protein O0544_23215 [Edwardsiella anguillarum]|nr:hypothetical protein [Edwardsiella anguillarum]
MTQQQPQAKYRRDYKTPDYTITDLDLDFVLDADCTTVTAVSQVTRLGSRGRFWCSTARR